MGHEHWVAGTSQYSIKLKKYILMNTLPQPTPTPLPTTFPKPSFIPPLQFMQPVLGYELSSRSMTLAPSSSRVPLYLACLPPPPQKNPQDARPHR